jgi:hypothetical protein
MSSAASGASSGNPVEQENPAKQENPISSKKKLIKLAEQVQDECIRCRVCFELQIGVRSKMEQKKIREIVLRVAGLKTWAKGKSWKKITIKNFFNKFVRWLHRKKKGIVPLRLKKTEGGRFTVKSLKTVGRSLVGTTWHMEKNHGAILTKTLKLLGLKKWNRKLMPCNLTFTQFLRKYVLITVEVNPSRQRNDWNLYEERSPIEGGINYGILTETVITQHEKGLNDTCPLCWECLPKDPNKVFTAVCKHSICYKCSREGHQYLFGCVYKCPLCRQTSTVSEILKDYSPNYDEFSDDESDGHLYGEW